MMSVESDVQADKLKSNCEISTRSKFSNTCSYVGIPSNAAAYLNTKSIYLRRWEEIAVKFKEKFIRINSCSKYI